MATTTKKRRPKGAGGVYQVARGKWRGFKQIVGEDGVSRRRWVTAASRAEVERRLEDIVQPDWDAVLAERAALAAAEEEAALVARRREHETLDAAVGQYLSATGRLAVKTRAQYEWVRTRHLGDLRYRHVSGITASDIRDHYHSLREHGLGDSSINAIHALLKRAFDMAKPYNGGLNPARDVTLPRRETTRASAGVTADDLARLQKVLDGDPLRASWEIALRLGLRPAERLGLRWSLIDLDAGTMTVRGQQQDVALTLYDNRRLGTVYLPFPKTARGERTLGIPADIAQMLRDYRDSTAGLIRERDEAGEFAREQERQRARIEEAIRRGDLPANSRATPYALPDDIVFLRPPGARIAGAPLDHVADRRLWQSLVRRAGLEPERLNRYAARHGTATRAFARLGAGEGSALRISESLGHGNPAFTLKTYVGDLAELTTEFGKTL